MTKDYLPQMGPLWTFWFFHRKENFKDLFLQHVFKNIYNYPNKLHYLCEIFLNKYDFFNVQFFLYFIFRFEKWS